MSSGKLASVIPLKTRLQSTRCCPEEDLHTEWDRLAGVAGHEQERLTRAAPQPYHASDHNAIGPPEVRVSVENAKQATLVDVAARAGVSTRRSRVINDHPDVAPSTRARILQAIEELRYLPNVAARILVTRRSKTVGIVSDGTAYFGPGQMVAHIEASFRERGYGLTLATLAELTLDALDAAVHELRGRAVDGIVMITPIVGIDPRAVRAACGSVPDVMIDIALGRRRRRSSSTNAWAACSPPATCSTWATVGSPSCAARTTGPEPCCGTRGWSRACARRDSRRWPRRRATGLRPAGTRRPCA